MLAHKPATRRSARPASPSASSAKSRSPGRHGRVPASGRPSSQNSRMLLQQQLRKLEHEPPDLSGDYLNVLLLLLLYFLQGIPMGLSTTLDLMLQEGGRLSFEEQGIYSSVSWPYSLKMLWAPLVDAFFLPRMGRRKTWLVPCQVLIGLLLLHASAVVPALVGTTAESKPDVWGLTLLFFVFYLLAATQDIAVDGWALELLQKRNLGWASTCNAVGLTAGYTCSFTGLMALQAYGWCDLQTFMRLSGLAFLAVTLLVFLFKTEAAPSSAVAEMSVAESYRNLYRVLKLRSVQVLIAVLLTRSVAFSAGDTLTSRTLLRRGMNKESLASIMALLTPVSLVLPGLISPYTAHRPMRLFAQSYLPRMALVGLGALLVVFAPDFALQGMPTWFWASVLVLSLLGTVVSTVQFVSLMAFFAKVSDPAVGGSYMTTLNTATNLGTKWPSQLLLFSVTPLTTSLLDGYYVLVALTLLAGLAWIRVFYPVVLRLEAAGEKSWRL